MRGGCAPVAGLDEVRGLRAARARLGCHELTTIHQARQRPLEAQLRLFQVAYRARGEREQLCLQRVAIGSEILRTAPPLLPATALVAQLDRLLRGRVRGKGRVSGRVIVRARVRVRVMVRVRVRVGVRVRGSSIACLSKSSRSCSLSSRSISSSLRSSRT